ncbi:hypothetical protein IE81DRAFT_169444 [Ceraceosorus guamensis]|uniref:Uncharacterized protein n=1 Tax=Ceraceosorus guamensis TaxID=1522189 RepID=A0A316VWE6_9BASI|nr:hypothetical protein IE81DRAFT_169444 [Ceraceosorus guamensis]PWN41624.1 hypothetical protein IE81DRAFT_169444 [Ceraceosorus guamensis]
MLGCRQPGSGRPGSETAWRSRRCPASRRGRRDWQNDEGGGHDCEASVASSLPTRPKYLQLLSKRRTDSLIRLPLQLENHLLEPRSNRPSIPLNMPSGPRRWHIDHRSIHRRVHRRARVVGRTAREEARRRSPSGRQRSTERQTKLFPCHGKDAFSRDG